MSRFQQFFLIPGFLAFIGAALFVVWKHTIFELSMLLGFTLLALAYLVKSEKTRWDWAAVVIFGINAGLYVVELVTKS